MITEIPIICQPDISVKRTDKLVFAQTIHHLLPFSVDNDAHLGGNCVHVRKLGCVTARNWRVAASY
jgi:hypothetical protein